MANEQYRFDFAEYNGKVPMIDFLESLSDKDAAKVLVYIEKLIELLNVNSMPNQKLSKYIDDGIFELRVTLKNVISRSFYFFMEDKNIIFTHGFIKKTQTTPSNEINKAIKIRNNYMSKI